MDLHISPGYVPDSRRNWMELYAIMSKPCIAYRPMSKGGRVLIEIPREVELVRLHYIVEYKKRGSSVNWAGLRWGYKMIRYKRPQIRNGLWYRWISHPTTIDATESILVGKCCRITSRSLLYSMNMWTKYYWYKQQQQYPMIADVLCYLYSRIQYRK